MEHRDWEHKGETQGQGHYHTARTNGAARQFKTKHEKETHETRQKYERNKKNCDAMPQWTGLWPRHESIMAKMISRPFRRDDKDEATNQEPVKRSKVMARVKEKEVEQDRTREGQEWACGVQSEVSKPATWLTLQRCVRDRGHQ